MSFIHVRKITAATRRKDHHDIADLHLDLADVRQFFHAPRDSLDKILAGGPCPSSRQAECTHGAAVA